MAGYTYATFTTALASTMSEDSSATPFTAILPTIIDQAEQRCYRDCDFLAVRVRDTSGTATANSLQFTLPQPASGIFRVVEGINIVTPVGSTVSTGTRNPLQPVSLDFLNFTYQSNTATAATAIPTYFAMVTDQTVQFGPAPGAAFSVEVVGTIRPAALSVSNTTTYLSQYYPDLFLAAAMVFASGWQKNFSAASDDPRSSQSWENQYQKLLASANLETGSSKFAAASWTSKRPEAAANSQRG